MKKGKFCWVLSRSLTWTVVEADKFRLKVAKSVVVKVTPKFIATHCF